MELRNFLDKADAPVLIDQEGGRVVRLDRRIRPVYPPGAAFGDPALGSEAARLRPRLIAGDEAVDVRRRRRQRLVPVRAQRRDREPDEGRDDDERARARYGRSDSRDLPLEGTSGMPV